MPAVSEKIEDYSKSIKRKTLLILVAVILIIITLGLSLSIGTRPIPFNEVYGIVIDHLQGTTYDFGTDAWWDDYVIWNTRLPRAIIALIAGAGLSVAGSVLQGIMKNPLADAYTTGVSSAAVFGVTLAMIIGFSISTDDVYGVVFNSFVFGLIPASVMIVISRHSHTGPATLILSGIALSYLFGSLSTIIMTTADNQSLAAAYVWQIGSLQDLSWNSIPIMLTITFTGTIVMTLISKKINIMSLGDSSAKSLGVDPDNFRLICLSLTSLMVASIISFTGILGFIGLVVPHIVRSIIGADNRFVIPGSAIIGALFLLVVDLIARVIVIPEEIPVGIVMSFIGAPIFLILILKMKKEVW